MSDELEASLGFAYEQNKNLRKQIGLLNEQLSLERRRSEVLVENLKHEHRFREYELDCKVCVAIKKYEEMVSK